MARVPTAPRPRAWTPPQARIDGDRLLKARQAEQRVMEAKAKVEAEAKRVEEMESQKLDEKVDDLREQLDRLTSDLPKILPSGGGGKRMVAKVLARDYPDLNVFEGLAKADGNFVVADGTNWTVKGGEEAREALGLGTAATTDATAYATAAQGGLADTAMQPSTYDPGNVAGDAFDMDNMAEGADTKIMTAAERAIVADAVTKAGTETITGAKTFQTALSGTTPLRVESTDASASQGPFLEIARVSASPAANDALGGIRFRGMDAAGTETLYTAFSSRIVDPTDGSEDGALEITAMVAGVSVQAAGFANGLLVGAATGSYQGTGTVNATGYYLNGTALSSTLFGVAVGDASGNLKALNADGGLTFATTTTSVNINGTFGGAWVVAHRIFSSDTATYTGSRTTTAIMRNVTGSGTNGPSRADYALHVESVKTNYLTSAVQGEIDGMNIVVRQGSLGDAAGILINVGKVANASYGSLAWEAASSWVAATTGSMIRLMRTSSGHQGSAADLRGGGMGFNASAMTGDHGIAFAALADHTDTGRWKYPFLGADGYANGDEYFYVTGPAHADGMGLVRGGDGSVALPTFSFVSDPDTGMFLTTANDITFATGGTARLRITSGGTLVVGNAVNVGAGSVNAQGNYYVAATKVVGARATGWAAATGTATRTTFATGSVTLPQLAERVKALIDDLHSTAGHGLLGT